MPEASRPFESGFQLYWGMVRVKNVAYTPPQRVFFGAKAPEFVKSGVCRDSVPRAKRCQEPAKLLKNSILHKTTKI
jgi:hypothetical protein